MIHRFGGEDVDMAAVMRDPVSRMGRWFRYRERAALSGGRNIPQGMTSDAFVTADREGRSAAFARMGSRSKFLEPQRNGTRVTHLFRDEDQAGFRAFSRRPARGLHRTGVGEPLAGDAAEPLGRHQDPPSSQARRRFKAVARDRRARGLCVVAGQAET